MGGGPLSFPSGQGLCLHALVLGLAGSCACVSTYSTVPVPDQGGPWEVPIVDTLEVGGLRVVAYLQAEEGAGRPEVETFLTIDTGAHRSQVSRRVARALGAAIESGSRYSRWGPRSNPDWHGAVFPGLRLGRLILEEMPLGLHPWNGSDGELGNEILFQQPFAVDRDRGVLILGADPWTDLPGLIEIPYQPVASTREDNIEVEVDGHALLMRFDTGVSPGIEASIANEIGITAVPHERSIEYRGPYGAYSSTGYFVAWTLRIGPLVWEDVLLEALPYRRGGLMNRKVVGRLGIDFFESFNFRIDREAGVIQLRRRKELVATVPARIARWPWVPRCESSPGCVETRLERSEAGLSVFVSTTRPYPRPVAILVGILDEAGKLFPTVPLTWLEIRRFRPGDTLRFTLDLGANNPARAPGPEGARRAVLLEVSPLQPGEAAAREGSAWEHRIKEVEAFPRRSDPTLAGKPVAGSRAVGGMSHGVIQRAIQTHQGEIRRCYGALLARTPKQCGKVTVRFMVDRKGRVVFFEIVESTIEDEEMIECITQNVERWHFPMSEGDGKFQITYPWVFRPEEGEEGCEPK